MSLQSTTQEVLKRLAEQKFALDQSAIVAQTNAQGVIEYVNEKFCEISGYNREELIGKTHKVINSGAHPKDFFKQMWSQISKGQIWRGEVCNRAKSGHLYWVNTTIVPFLNEAGKPHQYLAIRQDITGLKEAEQKILDQQGQMIASSKLSAIGEMASAITHEINNPLGVILGRCEMIKTLIDRGNVDIANLKRLVDTIEVNGRRIEKIVKSMKSLSHHGEEDPFLPTSVTSIVQDLTDLLYERFKNHQVRLRIDKVEENLTIECRSHEVLQVLVNLLNNAFDAVQDLDEKWVDVKIFKKDNSLVVSVTDSGKGIAPEIVEKLFKPFFSTKRVQYGTGLGLSISKSLIQRHQGRLEYDSSSPHTCFVVTLPLLQVQS